MKVLHLTLKKKWFDMILSGEKTEEYREIKPYWIKRLHFDIWNTNPFDIIRFTNGYGKDAPTFDIESLGIKIDNGKSEWGANYSQDYYVIKLGKIISTKNINHQNK